MKDDRQKVGRIIDELVMFQFNAGARDIHMDLHYREKGVEIVFTSNCTMDMERNVERLNRYLSVPRNEAMEAYFWGLAGEDEGCHNEELQLIGQMVDEGHARMQNDKLIIRVYRRQ